eukprot:576856-Amphidinium_carterae.1
MHPLPDAVINCGYKRLKYEATFNKYCHVCPKLKMGTPQTLAKVNISVIGTVLCFLANLGRAVKGVFQQDRAEQ